MKINYEEGAVIKDIKDELLDKLLESIKGYESVQSASRIDGENVIGIELTDGIEYFIELQDA